MDLRGGIFGFLAIFAGLFLIGLVWNMLKDLIKGPPELPTATPRFKVDTFHKPSAQKGGLYSGTTLPLHDARGDGVKIASGRDERDERDENAETR